MRVAQVPLRGGGPRGFGEAKDSVPWREGFARIDRHLSEQGRPRAALCGIELRSPPLFAQLNAGYREMLASWKILLGDDNPIPRTTRGAGGGGAGCPVPVRLDLRWPGPPWPDLRGGRGAGELAERARGAEGIVRRGDTSRDAMREEARFVMGIMHERVRALGAAFRRVTTINVYTEHPHSFLVKQFLAPVGPAAVHGMRGFPRRPPI
jgi:hypothetical protein